MATIIGFASGTQLVVTDIPYVYVSNKTQAVTRIFLSADKKRVITVPDSGSIEFFDEPVEEHTIHELEVDRFSTLRKKGGLSDHYEPNIG